MLIKNHDERSLLMFIKNFLGLENQPTNFREIPTACYEFFFFSFFCPDVSMKSVLFEVIKI